MRFNQTKSYEVLGTPYPETRSITTKVCECGIVIFSVVSVSIVLRLQLESLDLESSF